MPTSSAETGAALTGRTARLMFYCLLSIVLIALDARGRYVEQVHRVVGELVDPALLLIETPFAAARRLGEDLGLRRDLAGEVAELEQRLLIQSARLGLLADLARENAELRDLLGAAGRLEQGYLTAELVDVDLDPFAHRVVVKRGRADGIEPGQPVLDAGGVLGQVERVHRHTARVILLSDPDHALPVQIQRTGARTIAYGTGSVVALRLADLPMNVDLEPGDLVTTSGLGERFPPGLPVGTVVSVDRSPGQPFASAIVEPAASMDSSRHVLIVEVYEGDSAVPGEAPAAEEPGPEPGEDPPAGDPQAAPGAETPADGDPEQAAATGDPDPEGGPDA